MLESAPKASYVKELKTSVGAALVLAGAAGKGPFAAGAVQALSAQSRLQFRFVAGASSGALNAAVFAAGLRSGDSQEAAADLCTLWQNQANLGKVLRFKARKQLVLKALRKFAERPTQQKAVKLRISVASLPGRIDEYGGLRFEEAYTYEAQDLCDARRLDEISEVCVASAALPGLFRPRKAGHGGPYIDGGVVDNAPIGWALSEDEQVSCVVVVTPTANRVKPGSFGWLPLFRIVDMLSAERLHRELNQAKSVNERLDWLTAQQVDLSALLEPELSRRGISLSELRPVCRLQKLDFLEVRPEADLAGNLLTGFLSAQRRLEYIESGRIAAAIALSNFQRGEPSTSLSRTG